MNWWRFVVASEIRKILAFRTDFWVTFLGQTLIQLFIARSLWEAIFESSGKSVMEGYTLETMTLYYLIVPIGSKMLTGENLGFLSREIYEETFSRYLLYPISFFNYKTITYLTYSAFYGLQLSLAFVGYHLLFGSLDLNQIVNLLSGLCFFMLASYAYCNLALLVELISLWADNIWSLMVMVRFLCFFFGGAYIPLSFFPSLLQSLIKFTPFPYLVSLPINVMMDKLSITEMLVGAFILTIWSVVFNFGARPMGKRAIYLHWGRYMNRYIKLYLCFLQFSFSKALEFRIDFFFRIAMDIMYYFVNIALFKILLIHTPLIAGWNEEQMMIFVGGYLLVDAINMTIFSTNMWWLPFYINRGELDYYLIRPVSPLFFLSLREFSANSFVNLIIAALFFFYSLFSYSQGWSLLSLFGLFLLLINGSLVYYCIQMLMILPVFWTQSARGFIDLFYTLGLAMERPDKIFKGWLRVLFTIILPFGLIASFPARIFIEGFDIYTFSHLTIVSFLLWITVLLVWRRGLKNYSSASS